MKILLISANKFAIPYPVYPLGLDYVAGALLAAHEVRLLDLAEGQNNSAAQEAAREFQPDLVGLSIRNIDNTDISGLLSFIADLKEIIAFVRKGTEAPIVLGGAGFTLFPKALIAELGAEYGIVGEGERFARFAELYARGHDVSNCEGVITPDSPEKTPQPYAGEIKRGLEATRSIMGHYIKNGGMLNIQTKRGCPFNCIYCTYPRIEGKEVRNFEPSQIAETAKELEKAGAKYLYIADSVFNVEFEHSLKVAKAFKKANLSIPWGAFFSPMRPPEGYYKTLKDCGLTHVEFGTEALSSSMLKTYRKPFNIEDVFCAHLQATEAGLFIAHYFMLGGPGETTFTIEETLDNANKLQNCALFFFCGIRIYPGSEIYDIALREGQISPEEDLLLPIFYQSKEISVEEITRKVSSKAAGRINWLIGAGGEKMIRIVQMLHRRGETGPLWEKVIR